MSSLMRRTTILGLDIGFPFLFLTVYFQMLLYMTYIIAQILYGRKERRVVK